MFPYTPPAFDYCGIKIIEDENCLQTWQLNDFTKELMGAEWVKKFNAWAEHALPKQPACYMVGGDKLVTHPLVAQAIRYKVQQDDKIKWRTSYGYDEVKRPTVIGLSNFLA